MAELVLIPVINKVIDIASDLLKEGGSRLYWLKSEIDWLHRQLNLMQSYLEDAQSKGAGDQRVAILIKQIEELGLDVEDLLDTYLSQMQSREGKGSFGWLKAFAWIFPYSYTAHNLAMEIEKIRRRVEQIEHDRTTYDIRENDGGNEGIRRELFLHAAEWKVVGRDEKSMELKKILLQEGNLNTVISIVGMPGVGKTTVAKRIYNLCKHKFSCSAVVYVSQHPKPEQLLQSIAKQFGVGENWDLSLVDLQRNLLSVLPTKKYLLLLDDIWETQIWDNYLQYIFPTTTETGSKIILTSRNDNVCRHIGGGSSLHRLLPLNEEDSMKLFQKSVMAHQGDTNCFPELEDIGKSIVAKCGGVPLAIVLTAGILRAREKTERQWSLVLQSMGQDIQDECSQFLGLSYKNLPSKLKPCFLYLGLFPEDHEIPALNLIRMWMAEKFIRAKGKQEAEDVGEEYLNDLAARNLVQVIEREFDGRIKTCCIHDLLHNFCTRFAAENNFFHTLDALEKLDTNSVMKVRRLTSHDRAVDNFIALEPQMPKLRALLFFDKDQHFKNTLRKHKLLRVLRVALHQNARDEFMKEISDLSLLSYLEESKQNIFHPPPHKLKNLQTLHMRAEVNDSMWKMKELRHWIQAQTIYPDSFCPKQVCLPNLQTLHLWIKWRLPNQRSRKDPKLRRLFVKLPSLIRLEVEGYVEPVLEALSSDLTDFYPKIEFLDLHDSHNGPYAGVNLSSCRHLVSLVLSFKLERLPNHYEFPPQLIHLRLHSSNLTDDPMWTLGKLPKLQILELGWDAYTGVKMLCYDGDGDGFPCLKSLLLTDLSKLEAIIAHDGALKRLETFEIRYCPKLSEKKIPVRLLDIIRRDWEIGDQSTWLLR